MRHLFHLIVALTMFMIGTSASALLSHTSKSKSSENTISRLAEETAIQYVVFRHQIEQNPNLERNIYYLSCYNYSDPSAGIMIYLNENGLPAKPLSQLHYDSYFPNGGEIRVFVRVGSIRWVSDSEVVVAGSLRASGLRNDSQAYMYRLVRDDRGWKIISSETIS
jgi:hypothetical protein